MLRIQVKSGRYLNDTFLEGTKWESLRTIYFHAARNHGEYAPAQLQRETYNVEDRSWATKLPEALLNQQSNILGVVPVDTWLPMYREKIALEARTRNMSARKEMLEEVKNLATWFEITDFEHSNLGLIKYLYLRKLSNWAIAAEEVARFFRYGQMGAAFRQLSQMPQEDRDRVFQNLPGIKG